MLQMIRINNFVLDENTPIKSAGKIRATVVGSGVFKDTKQFRQETLKLNNATTKAQMIDPGQIIFIPVESAPEDIFKDIQKSLKPKEFPMARPEEPAPQPAKPKPAEDDIEAFQRSLPQLPD